MLRLPGEFRLSNQGFYLTGEYKPFRGFGHQLERVHHEEESGESKLVFTWAVMGEHSWQPVEKVVPVPPGQEGIGRAILEHFHKKLFG